MEIRVAMTVNFWNDICVKDKPLGKFCLDHSLMEDSVIIGYFSSLGNTWETCHFAQVLPSEIIAYIKGIPIPVGCEMPRSGDSVHQEFSV